MPDKDHEQNRAAWNETTDLHIYHSEYRTQEVLDGGSSLKRIEKDALGDVKSKTLLHLMCHFGLDALSWARAGAKVTGVDISDRSIEVAEDLKKQTELNVNFVRSDVLELIGKIDNNFDIVFQSYGTLIWISDIVKWAEVVAHHLEKGGTFFIVDEHPLSVLYQDTTLEYFSSEPERLDNATDYCDTDYKIKSGTVEWQHPLFKIINALVEAGLTIEWFEEFNHGYYKVEKGWYRDDEHYWYPPGGPTAHPLMMSIKARKN